MWLNMIVTFVLFLTGQLVNQEILSLSKVYCPQKYRQMFICRFFLGERKVYPQCI
ncbi:hypothetical protein HanXRQr2_Chr12g0544381 [Helianthus annuus]|uniref:Uncharacterized protein n=1 Tax=Helianthus annuus TaxID=4232 RepID=A0A251T2Z7_HELAN|nr:hypothetical protein HanXRQr2_Chr12g0544381 [Helianthus annuus]